MIESSSQPSGPAQETVVKSSRSLDDYLTSNKQDGDCATARTSVMDDSTLQQRDPSVLELSVHSTRRSSPFNTSASYEENKDDDDASVDTYAEDELVDTLEPLTALKSSFKKYHVSFQSIEIQEYAIIPGDNPAVTMGVPVTIDWEPLQKVSCTVDEYEENRPEPPRSMTALRMPMRKRFDVLQKLHFSRQDILHHSKQANLIRNDRKRTRATMHLEPVQEFLERSRRSIANATWNRTKKQRERKWLRDHQNFMSKVDKPSCLKTKMDESSSCQRRSTSSLKTNQATASTAPLDTSSRYASMVTVSTTLSGKSAEEDDSTLTRKTSMKVQKWQERDQKRAAKDKERRLKRRQRLGPKIPNSIKKKKRQERLESHRRTAKSHASVEVWSKVKKNSIVREAQRVISEDIAAKHEVDTKKKKNDVGLIVREYSLTPTIMPASYTEENHRVY